MSPSSSDRQNMANLGEEVSVVDTRLIDQALNNSVVLRTIMQHLDTKDLLNVRAVAKKWEEEATIQLLSICQSHKVKFEWDYKEHKFRGKIGTIDEFTNSCYGNPLRKFPCSQFDFRYNEFNMNVGEALSEFFSNHGHHVKNLLLCLEYYSYHSLVYQSATFRIVRKIVFEWTPNLKSLSLFGDFYKDGGTEEPAAQEDKNTSKSSSNVALKRSPLPLEHLQLPCGYPHLIVQHSVAAQRWSMLIKDILFSAPNLQTVSDAELWFAKEIISAGKISTVTRFVWKLYPEGMMARGVEFSQTRPHLTFLKVDLRSVNNDANQRDPPSDFLPSLELILQSSRETLKTLKFKGRLDSVNGASRLNIPVMENLQEFEVNFWICVEGGQGRLLPEGFSVQQLFPNLKTLVLKDVGVETRNQADHPFGQSCNSSTTIEELTIGTTCHGDRFRSDWLRQARDLYPNVRVLNLEFKNIRNKISEICRTIWRSWKSLEELSFGLDLYDFKDWAEMMDQALTGFDQKTCRMLQKRCCKHCHGEGNMEREPSIIDMTKLKVLHLSGNPLDPNKFPLLSRVSVIHALEPMKRSQNLKVTVNGVGLTEMIQNDRDGDFSVPDCQMIMDEFASSRSRKMKFIAV